MLNVKASVLIHKTTDKVQLTFYDMHNKAAAPPPEKITPPPKTCGWLCACISCHMYVPAYTIKPPAHL